MKLSPCRLGLLAVVIAQLATNSVYCFSASNVPFKSSSGQGKSDDDGGSTSTTSKQEGGDSFIFRHFNNVATDIDDNLCPPSLKTILKNIRQLTHQGSDIRGSVVDHPRVGRLSRVSKAIDEQQLNDGIPALTPFAAFCLGHAFGQMVLQQTDSDNPTIAVGRDPRPHGSMLCDAFARGIQSVDGDRIRVVYTGVATTPYFCRAGLCDGAVMVTASHLPIDRNGFKLFTRSQGGFTKHHVQQMNQLAADFAQRWHDVQGMLPPTSGGEGVFCNEWVDFLPLYASSLQAAICKEVQTTSTKPLEGLKIVLNSGNGSGGFFNRVLAGLGADVSASMHVEPNGDFPAGIPNPEKKEMIADTVAICEDVGADLGILLDTDADRSGFIVPVRDGDKTSYEPLNRNRLIALLSVIFSRTSPGCAVVTDSVTSEGLAQFLEDDLGLQHVRHLKGYANVIGKAQELTESGKANAEMAIETSGHCAMKENGYLDDGTYTAVKVIGLLAREKMTNNGADLLGLIAAMKEMPEEAEIRMNVSDGSLETMAGVFELARTSIETSCQAESMSWTLDTDNLEGIRVRTGNGGFFMLRKSLHDPLISLQIEAENREEARENVASPLLKLFQENESISNLMETQNLQDY